MKLKSAYFDISDVEYIKSKCSDSPQSDEDKILAYLKSGKKDDIMRLNIIWDCFAPDKPINTSTYTDGYWKWDDALIYYVENYHYRLPEEFADHIKLQNHKA